MSRLLIPLLTLTGPTVGYQENESVTHSCRVETLFPKGTFSLKKISLPRVRYWNVCLYDWRLIGTLTILQSYDDKESIGVCKYIVCLCAVLLLPSLKYHARDTRHSCDTLLSQIVPCSSLSAEYRASQQHVPSLKFLARPKAGLIPRHPDTCPPILTAFTWA